MFAQKILNFSTIGSLLISPIIMPYNDLNWGGAYKPVAVGPFPSKRRDRRLYFFLSLPLVINVFFNVLCCFRAVNWVAS